MCLRIETFRGPFLACVKNQNKCHNGIVTCCYDYNMFPLVQVALAVSQGISGASYTGTLRRDVSDYLDLWDFGGVTELDLLNIVETVTSSKDVESTLKNPQDSLRILQNP